VPLNDLDVSLIQRRISTWTKFERADTRLLGGLIALGVLLPTAIALISNSFDIARNDDGSYRRLALHLFTTGRLELDGVPAMMLIGQLLIVQPFLWLTGGQTWALSLAGVAFATLAVAAVYLVVRRVLPPNRAALATLLLVLFPGYMAYAVSFMTDVPALAAQFASLGLGMVAMARGPVASRWLIAALTVGWIGFTIREFALAGPAAVFAAVILVEPRRLAHWISGLVFLLACLAAYEWRSTLPGQIVANASPGDVSRVPLAVSTVAFVLLPAALISWRTWWREWRVPDVAAGAGLGVLVLADRLQQLFATGQMPQSLLHGLVTPWGVPDSAVLAGVRPALFADALWAAVNGLALFATIAVVAALTGILGLVIRSALSAPASIATRLASPLGLLAIFAAGTSVGLFGLGRTWWLFDRYFWPLAPVLAALLLLRPARPAHIDQAERAGRPVDRTATWRRAVSPATAALALISLGGIALAFALNSAAFDAARWRMGELAVARGMPPESVDAGYEWVNYHAMGIADQRARTVRTEMWYDTWWPSFHLCGLASSSTLNLPGFGLEAIEVEAYRLLLIAGPMEPLYLYRVAGPGCP
jgi:hypothetical protein